MTDAERAFQRAEEKIREAIAEGATKLTLSGQDFATLADIPASIAGITGLRTVLLGGTEVSDLAPLAEIAGLQTVDLHDTKVTDLTALERITGLNTLDLNGTQVRDLTSLRGITGLQTLHLSGTRVADLAPLAGITGLQRLYLQNTQVTDLTPLARITGLQTLYLRGTQVTDLAPLAEITGLQVLYLSGSEVRDIVPLAGITGLQTLGLHSTKVTDLSPLAGITGLRALYLSGTDVSDLTPLGGITGLKTLYLRDTQVTDLTPLAKLNGLQALDLDNTRITELAPLAGITALRALDLRGTRVSDLRPLSGLSSLSDDSGYSLRSKLRFHGCLATAHDPELKRLSEIDDDQERTERTLAYLQSLPPWPEPLPWVPAQTPAEGALPTPPEVDGLPQVRVTPEGIDVVPGTATAEDLADPVKVQLYDQLGPALDALLRQGNRYPEVAGPVQAMRALVSVPFAEADILGLHLQLCALADVKTEDAARPETEKMDADCRIALGAVLRMAPPITMGHPKVSVFEERNTEFMGERVTEAQAESERRLAASIGRGSVPATDAAQAVGTALGGSETNGRLKISRRDFVKGAVIGAGAMVVTGAFNEVGAQGSEWAVKWLAQHKNEIWTAAQGWGGSALAWVKDMLAHLFGPRRL